MNPADESMSRSRSIRWDVIHVSETGSTNDDVVQAALGGAPHGRVLVADHQRAGRGRLDRRWDAPPGANLLVSVLFRNGWQFPHELTQRVALAAADAAEQLAGVTPALKWPNDLLIDGKKLAGILAQAGGHSGVTDFIVVGMGLNLGWAPDTAARLAGVDRDDFLAAWLDAMAQAWTQPITSRYRASLSTVGQRVRVERSDGMLEGDAVDVDADGTLIVVGDDQHRHRISVGDVIHLRPAAT
jgi:BirA family transcriptional regulator, biotin operon repressor / biotin---[acetyl-CoA-carboxylase] ligase